MMRIIAGRARGTHLVTLEGDATRPTGERAKEAVFSMIQFDLTGRTVLDLFGGSGQMALEALSRGAGCAVIVDASREAAEVIRRNAEKTHLADECTILTADYAAFLRGRRPGLPEKYSLVILDPPYALHLIRPALELLLSGGLLTDDAIIVCESGHEDIFDGDTELESKFRVTRRAKYGTAYVTLLTPDDGEEME